MARGIGRFPLVGEPRWHPGQHLLWRGREVHPRRQRLTSRSADTLVDRTRRGVHRLSDRLVRRAGSLRRRVRRRVHTLLRGTSSGTYTTVST